MKLILSTVLGACVVSLRDQSESAWSKRVIQATVDVRVLCMSKGALGKANCGVSSIRRALTFTDPESISLIQSESLSYPSTSVEVKAGFPKFRDSLRCFTRFLADIDELGSEKGNTAITGYLRDPLKAFALENSSSTLPSDQEMDISLVERRLGLLYNTLWKAGWSYYSAISGNMSVTDAQYWQSAPIPEGIGPIDMSDMPQMLLNTTSHTTFPLPSVYALDIPWTIFYFVSVGVMLSAAVVSIVLQTRCTTPPVLGYVSSLVRDSVYFDQDRMRGNSTESGVQKTERLGDVNVVLSDVHADGDVGRMAFTPLHRRVEIRKERWYE